jgi:hypothetical protein
MNVVLNMEKITWDNSYIGEIDSLVSDEISEKKYLIVSLRYNEYTTEKAILYEFESFVPLICEDFKDIFNLRKNGKHIVKYKSKHMIMIKYKLQTNLKDYMKMNSFEIKDLPDYIKKDIQKFIVFRYIFCLKNINETSFDIVYEAFNPPFIINNLENDLNYKVKVTRRLINDWFGNTENFIKTIKSMINGRDISLLRFQIQNIIEKYDKNLIGWSNIIYNRLLLNEF